jgi:hypothetical protein
LYSCNATTVSTAKAVSRIDQTPQSITTYLLPRLERITFPLEGFMEWHALSCGNVLYFILDDADPGGGVQATVCSGKAILNVESHADRPSAMTWLASERKAKLHDDYCTTQCYTPGS